MRAFPLLLALLAWIPAVRNPAWGQAPSVGLKAGQNEKRKPENEAGVSTPRGTPENPFVVDTRGHKQTDVEAAKAQEEAAEAKSENDFHNGIDTRTLRWIGITAGATTALVLVGLGGVIAALRTLNLMAVPYRSYITLQNWRVSYDPNARAIEKLKISVDVVNGTGFPLTITEGSVKCKIAGGPGYVRYEVGERTFLAPNSPHTITLFDFISEDHAQQFTSGLFIVPIEGYFSHFGQLGEKTTFTQHFAGLLECGEGREPKFWYEIPLNPEPQANPESNRQHKPNA